MQEIFEKIIEKLEELKNHYNECCLVDYNEGAAVGLTEAMNIVRQAAAEDNNGWIPCSELAELKRNHGFPCEVGDIVYRVSLNDVKEYKVFAINIGIRENASSCAILTKNNRGAVIDFETIDFGKTVFLTREEAEAKLAEMESGNERD